MKRSTATFMAGLMLISMRANAQVKPGTQQVAITLGAANPLSYDTVDGERAKFGATGPALGFSYLYQLRRHLSFGGDFNYKSLGEKDISTGHGPAVIKSSAWTLMAIAKGDMMPDSNIRPYGLMGLGIGGVKRESRFSQSPRFDMDQTSGGLAFALGGGADFDINPSWLAGAELRYNIIGTNESDIGTDNVRTLDLLFKVGYKF